MLIPFIGLLIGDFNYVLQSAFLGLNPYLVLISDLVFGVCGGFTAVIGMFQQQGFIWK